MTLKTRKLPGQLQRPHLSTKFHWTVVSLCTRLQPCRLKASSWTDKGRSQSEGNSRRMDNFSFPVFPCPWCTYMQNSGYRHRIPNCLTSRSGYNRWVVARSSHKTLQSRLAAETRELRVPKMPNNSCKSILDPWLASLYRVLSNRIWPDLWDMMLLTQLWWIVQSFGARTQKVKSHSRFSTNPFRWDRRIYSNFSEISLSRDWTSGCALA